MNPTALIAEDEPLLAANLESELARAWPELAVVANVPNGTRAVAEALAQHPDVVFLDIRMPGLTGLEAAQAIAEDWPETKPGPQLVFVTAYDHYAVQAFEHAAADYLLKPVQPERLVQCCERLRRALRERTGLGTDAALARLRELLAAPGLAPSTPSRPAPLNVIQASVGAAIHLVPIEQVIYFEAADKYVRVVTAEREYLIRMALRDLLPQLDPQRFWQVHRGTVVRADAITTAVREESGKVHLSVRGRPEKLMASRLYAGLFKAM
ncbi:MAG: LytTR family DNA-binding domain-containing protein [Pseudomonadota bacterium]|nr:LytTR family DNA-binding domain-containing protein [Pseudomonadota bacterium]